MILKTNNLSKRFKHRLVVSDLNLEVEKGQIFGFLGPNGAGKSTTIRMLLSLIAPTSGNFELFGGDWKTQGKKVYSKVGALVEAPDFYLYLSAERNLKILGELNGWMSRNRIYEVLDIVRLKDRARDKVKSFSHGMRQRLGIAQAIMCKPELIILDEPTSGLDPEGIKEIRDLIVSLSKDLECTVFLSSHILHEIEQVCTHMGIIDHGKLIVQGEVQNLLRETDFFVTEVSTDKPQQALNLLQSEPWVKKVALSDEILKVHLSAECRPKLAECLIRNKIRVSSIIPRTSLEDYYLSLVKSESEK